ncbi:5'-Nucleotidase domain-containing protein [Desulfurispirillum indicum S5]|uniref:5'-Nucleotidase domain-containing protein n=1 Tax=Desulfurispirillum indicum (strain ATCC BAA-1389 / DSM 22839 / S5) TaxID=653733 RepID=E6W0K8_DESIS|nr:5'-nucleotidase C-terminal domain-containing protein [Desulfurispirillum indicum]ADU65260.1 5'-Nucleotidase domain-containing protein [Desulfurispirillum indicum S5]
MKMRLFAALALALGCSVFMFGCGSSSSSKNDDSAVDFSLQLLHFADVDGGGTRALENVEYFSALVEYFRAEMPESTLLVSSGDNYIPGPVYQASAELPAEIIGKAGVGRGEIAMMNAMGLQVSAVGNHDLDGGPSAFAGIITPDGGWEGAQFPWISANLDYSSESSLASLTVESAQEADTIAGKLAPSVVITVNGEPIGLVGAVTPGLASITSTGNIDVLPDSDDIDALAAVIQAAVDELRDADVNKIILLAHMQQISVEKQLAVRLSGVDIIVAGGSNTLLADSNDVLHPGDSAADTYPLVFESPENEPVLVVNTDGDYKYLGRLVVGFDSHGRIVMDSLDPGVNGAYAALSSVVPATAEPIPAVVDIADALRAVLQAKDGNVAGYTSVFLEGRRNAVRSKETNLGNLSADANLWYATRADGTVVLSLKNGGGIRAQIGQVIAPPGSTDASDISLLPPQANSFKAAGAISQLDIETSLAFNNTLSLVSVTAAELWDIMEHAVASANPGATPGAFPQIGGLRFSFDPSATARTAGDTNAGAMTTGERISVLMVGDDVLVSGGVLQGDPSRAFRMVTLNFLVSCVPDTGGAFDDNCGDGYPFKGLSDPDRKDLVEDFAASAYDPGEVDFADSGSEQDALAEFLRHIHGSVNDAYAVEEVPVAENTRIVNLSAQADITLP